MTREEYQAETDITSPEEAQALLSKLQWLFIGVFGFRLCIYAIEKNIYPSSLLFLLLCDVALVIYFVVFCLKVIRLTRTVTKANVFWSIFLAPISWAWFYPEITKPLKIIIGELPPPEKIQTMEERKAMRKAINTNYWKTLLIAIGIAALFAVIVFVKIMFEIHSGQ